MKWISKRRYRLSYEEEIAAFNKLVDLNPNKGIPYINALDNTTKDYTVVLYSWFTGLDHDIKVFTTYLYRYLYEYSKLVLITPQIYYDVIILGLTNIKDRPVCKNCGKLTRFDGFKYGYLDTCSKECRFIIRDKRLSELGKYITKTLLRTDKFRKDASERMKRFYKTEEGKKLKQKSSELTSKRNVEMMINKSYYSSSCRTSGKYKVGIYKSTVFDTCFNYDSSWEYKFIKFLETKKDKWKIRCFDRCKEPIIYYWEDGSKHRYLPDFYIEFDNIKMVIEIKPHVLYERDPVFKLKRIAAKKYFSKKNIKYITLTEKDLFTTKYHKYSKYMEDRGIISSFYLFDYC